MKYLNNKKCDRPVWPIKALATAVIVGLTATLAQAAPAANTNRKPIGDLEIYAAAKPGTASIFMMLDTSGSMGNSYIDEDYGSQYDKCSTSLINSEKIRSVIYERKLKLRPDGSQFKDDNGNIVMVKDFDKIHKEISFTPRGCTVDGITRYSRLVRLQIALIELLADNVYAVDGSLKDTGSLQDDYEIGLGNYSYEGDGKTGVVLVPTQALTAEQRGKLVQETYDLKATGNTPTAHALAESGAYMMGTTTVTNTGIQLAAEREYRNSTYYFRRCKSNASTPTYDNVLKKYVLNCNTWNDWSKSSSVLPSEYHYENTPKNGRNYYVDPDSNIFSGFEFSIDNAKKTDKKSYQSPLNANECSGNGIYILTDGEPNASNNDRAKAIMNTSLQDATKPLAVTSCSGLKGGSSSGAWGCMADYATLLRNPANNSLGLPIKTATVGFGKTFDGLTGKREITINDKTKEVVDCNSGNAKQDARNLCKLGERRGDNETKTFGDGGFYYTEESADIANSIVDFAAGLVQIINTAPSGTITIPNDPYRASNQLPYAYLPMLDPSIATTASIWKGNLKKYKLDKGTLLGNANKLLYKDVSGDLNEATQDLWQDSDFEVDGVKANNTIIAGGVYAQLKAPGSDLGSVRSIYVEDYTSIDDKTPILRKLSVNPSGQPVGFESLVAMDVNPDTGRATYDQINQRRLLSFLGFDNVLTKDGLATSTTLVKNLILTAPTKTTKVLGGVVHSKPTAISYSATLDDNGRISSTRDDYVLFGSMDGALHLVGADDGKEEIAVIPKYMLDNQPEALVDNSTKDKIGEPYFGVDAPWLVTTDYDYGVPGSKVKVSQSAGKGMFAYGGLRMGGEAFYGMDISKKSVPKTMFTITKEGLNYSATTEFARLGQIWSKPTAAKIRQSKDAEPTNVLIFGGGYDMEYENDEYVATTAAPARGNAIYIIDASNGKLIWSTSSDSTSGKNVKAADMIHSITGEITVLDRDNDGLMDHIYAADLGGQVFRADFENARKNEFGFAAVNSFANKGVTRILNTTPSNKKYAYRFYERPIVSFYRNEGVSNAAVQAPNNGQLFALVNVISGNRSAPLSTLRDDNTYANRVYGIIDTDITDSGLYKTGFSGTIKDLTEAKLTNLATELGSTPNTAKKNTAKLAMIMSTKNGWYYPLTRFDGYNKVRYNKGVGDSAVINNLLYTTVYNPDKQYGDVASCAAKISGGSERQLYCLPYGVCMDDDSISGTGGYVPAGQGIQELTLGAYNEDNTDVKVLISTLPIDKRIEEVVRAAYGNDNLKNDSNIKDLYPGEAIRPTQGDGDGTASEFLFNERYTLQPLAWYEQKQ